MISFKNLKPCDKFIYLTAKIEEDKISKILRPLFKSLGILSHFFMYSIKSDMKINDK